MSRYGYLDIRNEAIRLIQNGFPKSKYKNLKVAFGLQAV